MPKGIYKRTKGNHTMPHTEETKKKISLAKLGVPNPLNCQKSNVLNGIECFECSKCHQFLPKDAFYKEKRLYHSRVGIQSQCKKCHNKTSVATRDLANTRILRIKSEAKRRAIKAGSYVGRISFVAIKLRDKMICGLCGKKVREKELSLDHIIPLSCGGAHAEWNLQVAHRSCNYRKYTGKIPSQTRLQITGLLISKGGERC